MENRNVIGLGLVGYGGFGRFLRTSWEPVSEAELRLVADANPVSDGSASPLRTNWQELIADPTIDLVAIATPPSTHADIACAAMEAGKHVLIEKPLATTRKDAERIRAVYRRTNRVVGIDFMLRFNPIVEAVHEWARAAPFGPLRRVVIENYAQDELLPPGHWFWDVNVSGGILVEHAVHFIDLVNACTPHPPMSVTGQAVRRNDNRIDRMLMGVVYEDGLSMSQYHAFSRPGFFEETTMRFVFDIAQVETRGWIPLAGTVRAIVNDKTEEALSLLPGLEIAHRIPVDSIEDVSRPHGWGDRNETGRRLTIRSGGIEYKVSEQIDAQFGLDMSKADAYSVALRALLVDVVKAIQSPRYIPRISLQDGISSLEIALKATEMAGILRT